MADVPPFPPGDIPRLLADQLRRDMALSALQKKLQGITTGRTEGKMTVAQALDRAVADVIGDVRMVGKLAEMEPRMAEFSSMEQMMLAVIGADKYGSEFVTDRLDAYWATNRDLPQGEFPELCVGAGLTTAIYAATRAMRGMGKPYVLEKTSKVGGIWTMSKSPSFWLNSPCRPGIVGTPGQNQALTWIPGAPVQPADLTFGEYNHNAHLRFIVKVMLAKYAIVISETDVVGVSDLTPTGAMRLTVRKDGEEKVITPMRILDCRGTGGPAFVKTVPGVIMNFPEFMSRMDATFPMRGMKRVAVMGDEDAGKCVIEALLGLGPSAGRSVASLDYVDQVDWYGPDLPDSFEGWMDKSNGRYLKIGFCLQRENDAPNDFTLVTEGSRPLRLRVFRRKATPCPAGNMAIVADQVYDHAIMATGNKKPDRLISAEFDQFSNDVVTGDSSMIMGTKARGYNYYRLGPVADLQFSETERNRGFSKRTQNRVALFRQGPKIAAAGYKLS